MEPVRRNGVHSQGILTLWWNWTIGVGLLTLIIFIGMFVSKDWLPIIALGVNVILYATVRGSKREPRPVCYLIPYIAAIATFGCVILMATVNLMSHHLMASGIVDSRLVDPNMPYLTVLIVAPATMIVTAVVIMRGSRLYFCEDCRIRYGSVAERGLLGSIYKQESVFQLRVLLIMSASVSLISWLYYYLGYVSTYFQKTDIFFFRWMPVGVFVLTIAYFTVRYISYLGYYTQQMEWSHGRYSMIRFLIICDDYIFLSEESTEYKMPTAERRRLDTPAMVRATYREEISDAVALSYCIKLSDIELGELRFLYKTPTYNVDCNIYHYACFVKDRAQLDNSQLTGNWYTLHQIQRLNRVRGIAPILTAEIHRIYTVAMAWKTYDKDGYRLYDIRHYKPTFRLRDLHRWDVDINDTAWLTVAGNNEDVPFFRLRRLWRRYVNGINS